MNSHDKIIEAASKLFSRQGYHGTSTRQIAQLAGVGENTLFRQFDHKEEIFWSTLRYHSSGLKLRRDLIEELAHGEPPEVVLPKLLNLLSEMLIYKPELLRMIGSKYSAQNPANAGQKWSDNGPSSVVRVSPSQCFHELKSGG
jgi:AcrR family transcriptional regulator